MSDTPRTDAKIICDCLDKLASECKLNPTAYQRRGKEHVATLERENQQLRSKYAGVSIECEGHVKDNQQLREALNECVKVPQMVVSKVETGRMRSRETYALSKDVLSHPIVQSILKEKEQ